MAGTRQRRIRRSAEEGYVLAAVIILLAVMMLFLAAAMPKVRKDIQRDQEVETMRRGQQYIRAVQLYYRRFRHYPPNVEALEDSDNMRFLRKRFPDPLTGQDDWQPVVFGANKAPLSMGLFGQPLTMGAAVLSNAPTGSHGNAIIGSSPFPGGFMNGSNFGTGSDTSNQGSGSAGAPSSGSPGPVMGGAVIGFSPVSTKDSILVYKTKERYNEWEFVYDPMSEHIDLLGSAPPPTAPPVNIGSPGFGPGTLHPVTPQ